MCIVVSASKELRSDCTSRKILKIVAAHYMVILYPLSVKFELFCILRLMIIQRLDLHSLSQIKAGFVDRNIIDLKLLISA